MTASTGRTVALERIADTMIAIGHSRRRGSIFAIDGLARDLVALARRRRRPRRRPAGKLVIGPWAGH